MKGERNEEPSPAPITSLMILYSQIGDFLEVQEIDNEISIEGSS